MEIQIDSAADQAILSALREGKARQAAGMLVRYYGNAVYNTCRSLVPVIEQAEDLTQESFRCAFSRLDGILGLPSPRGWLMNVAQQCCADHLNAIAAVADADHPTVDPQLAGEAGSWRISESLQRRLEALALAL